MLPENITSAELHLLAYRSRETLHARLKAICREHSDRMKRLDKIMHQISAAEPKSDDGMPDISRLNLSPDLEMLLINPAHGL